ncbi:MAG: FG-GAP-like repeat-containing protein [Planctomycetota bacterium]|jgi:hypothetical protein
MYRTLTIAAVTALLAGFMTAQPTVTSVSPGRNGPSESGTANVTAGFSQNMVAADSSNFVVNGKLRGKLPGAYSGASTQSLSFDPTANLAAGEEIEVSLTSGLQNTSSVGMAAGHVFRYRAAAGAGQAIFDRVYASTGQGNGWDAEFGDLDGDGDMDMVTVDWRNCTIHFNDGTGGFATTASLGVGDEGAYGCSLADMDGDGDLDIIMVCAPGSTSTGPVFGQNKVFLNSGTGTFSSVVNFGATDSRTIDVDVGDIDGDGDLDIVTANGDIANYENFIYINNGSASFTQKHFLFYPGTTAYVQDNTWCVRLADADNDGDLDVYFGNFGFTGAVDSYFYLNDGAANFDAQRRKTIISSSVLSLAVADFDNDGDNDIAVGTLGSTSSAYYSNYVYWNMGTGSYSSMAWSSSGESVWGLEPADVDGDGDLDLAVGMEQATSFVYLNTGGAFSGTRTLGASAHNVAFADIDGDGDLDCGMPDRIAMNGTNPPGLNVQVGGNWLSNNDVVNVAHNSTLASQNIQIVVSDADSDPVSLATSITNSTTQGFTTSEWSAVLTSVSYTKYPTSGTFNQGSSTHVITITATDMGGEISSFSFSFVVGAAPNTPPSILVFGNSALVNNGGTLVANYGTSLSALNISVSVDDSDADTVSLAGGVSNKGTTGMLETEFSSASALTPYSVTPSTGVFNAGSVTHVVTLTADDGNGGSSAFTFEIVVGPAPQPRIAVSESSVGGTVIANGATATGNRAFGSQDVNAGATAVLTVVLNNTGTSALAVTSVTLTGTDASEFVLDTTNLQSSVPAATSTSFTVAFDPSTVGGKVATVSIVHDGINATTPYTFGVSGVATAVVTAPIIVVREGSITGTIVGNGSGAAGGRNFGSLFVGDTSLPLTIVIENQGNGPLTVGLPTVLGSGEFALDTTALVQTVPAAQTTSFSILFAPGTEGTFSGVVSFTHNDSSTTSPFSFSVMGQGSLPANGTGTGAGAGRGGSGGCAAGTNGSTLLFLILTVLGGLAVFRTRMDRKVA